MNAIIMTKEDAKNRAITTKKDFVAFIAVNYANPNGDLDGNMPRTDYDGYGIISDVCLKRKIRNRIQDAGLDIYLQASDRRTDEATNLLARASAKGLNKIKDADELARALCGEFADVRAFGTVWAMDKKLAACSSLGVRGPVSITMATSINPVDIISMKITKSVNDTKDCTIEKESSTIGTKHFVKFGLYKFSGSINVQMAEKTGFSDDDAEAAKEAIRTLFVNDESSARPAGTCEVVKLFWFDHNCKDGQYSPAKINRAVTAKLVDGVTTPKSVDDYEIVYNELPGLKCEIIDGI